MPLGFPGQFQGGYSTGNLNLGAVQKDKTGTEAGFPGTFQAGFTTGYLGIGAVQKSEVSGAAIKSKSNLLLMGVG